MLMYLSGPQTDQKAESSLHCQVPNLVLDSVPLGTLHNDLQPSSLE